MTDSNASRIRSLAEAANNISNPITEARTSPKEQEWANTHANLMREWFSHMSNQNVVDIFKIIKTKDYSAANMKKLKTYLMDAGITDRMGMVRPAKYQKPLDDIGALRSDETAVAIIKAGWAYFATRARPAAAAIAANNISNPITEARTSPKEHEWLSDMKAKDVTAISKLLKSKDTKALEQYLIANRLMGRDGLVQGKNLDRSAMEIIKRSFADVHEEVQVEEVETVEEAVKIDRNMNIKEMAAVLMDIADALMGKNVVTQRQRLMDVAQVLASRRFV